MKDDTETESVDIIASPSPRGYINELLALQDPLATVFIYENLFNQLSSFPSGPNVYNCEENVSPISHLDQQCNQLASGVQMEMQIEPVYDLLDISTSVRRNLSEQRQLTSSEKDNDPLSPSNSKPSGLFNSSVFEQLIEDNFVKINLEDELLALGIGLRQFEHNKYQELRQVVNMFNETQPAISNGNQSNNILKLTIERIQSHTEKWIKSLKFISSFNNICLDDQVLCIKSQFVNLCIVSSLGIINPETKSIQRNGINISMGKCPMMRDQRFINLLSSMDSNLRMDPIINVLLVLIHLFNSSTPNLTSNYNIRKEYIITVHLLQKYLEEVRGLSPNQADSQVSKLICDLNDFLSTLNGQKAFLDPMKTALVAKSKFYEDFFF